MLCVTHTETATKSIHLSIYLSLFLLVCMCIHPTIHPSDSPSPYLPIHLALTIRQTADPRLWGDISVVQWQNLRPMVRGVAKSGNSMINKLLDRFQGKSCLNSYQNWDVLVALGDSLMHHFSV